MTTAGETLLSTIVLELRETAQCVRRFDPDDVDGIRVFRALGRKAGRELGWKVRTFQLDPAQPGERDVVVYVAVIESTALHHELMRIRGDKAIRRAFNR